MSTERDETSDETEQNDEQYSVDRRTFLKGAGAAAGAATVGPAAQDVVTQDAEALSVRQDAEAAAGAVRELTRVVAPYAGGIILADTLRNTFGLTDPQGSTNQDLWETIYADAVNTEDDLTRAVTEAEGNLENTVGAALADGKIAMLQALKDGKTEANAANDAKSKIDDFYAKMQKSTFEHQKTLIEQLKLYEVQRVVNGITVDANNNNEFLYSAYVSGTPSEKNLLNGTIAQNEGGDVGTTGDQKGDLYHPVDPANADGISSDGDVEGLAFRDRDTTLVNGETITVTDIFAFGSGGNSPRPSVVTHYDGQAHTDADSLYSNNPYRLSLNVRDYGDTRDANTVDEARGRVLDARQFKNVLDQIEAARQKARGEMDALASDIYNNYTAGSISQEQLDQLVSAYDRVRAQLSNYFKTGSPIYAQGVAFENGLETTNSAYNVEIDYTPASNKPYIEYTNTTGGAVDILDVTRQSDSTTQSVSITGLADGETATIYLGSGTDDAANNIYYAGFSSPVTPSDTIDVNVDSNQDGTGDNTVSISYDYADELDVKKYQGNIYAFEKSAFGDNLQVGDVYKSALIHTPVQLIWVTDGGVVKRNELLGEWEITDIKDESGQSVDSVPVWEPEFQTTKTTDLTQQLQDYLDRQDTTDAYGPATGGGGGGNTTDLLLFGGIIGAIIYAYRKWVKGDGGGRGGRR